MTSQVEIAVVRRALEDATWDHGIHDPATRHEALAALDSIEAAFQRLRRDSGVRRKELLTRSALFIVTIVAFIASVMVWSCAPVSAHESWIAWGGYVGPDGTRCCGENDCRIIEESDISISPAGYTIKSLGETVPYMETLPSEDGAYWRCHKSDGSRRCFFAPQPAS